MRIAKGLFCLWLTLVSVKYARSQGCSDAGVCTVNSLKNNIPASGKDNNGANAIMIGIGYGKGEKSTNNYALYLEYTRALSKRTFISGKINYSAISGELANTNGPGDVFITVNHAFDTRKKWQKSFVLGVKVPLNNADRMEKNIALPMPYQTSLGTTDLIAAVSITRKSLGASLAFQQPLQSANKNKYLPEDYLPGLLEANYLPTNKFNRKGDVVGRLLYQFKTGKMFSIRPGLLGIFHLSNDSYIDKNETRKTIPGSRGLTLNGNLFLDYQLEKRNAIGLSLGLPVIVRDQRPDGLTRKFTASLEYRFSF
jgi:hypothetical protein